MDRLAEAKERLWKASSYLKVMEDSFSEAKKLLKPDIMDYTNQVSESLRVIKTYCEDMDFMVEGMLKYIEELERKKQR